jgi:hypothetical protein
MLRETVIASAVLAAAITLIAGLTGHLMFGLSIGAGLMLGSGNGYLFLALLNHGAPIVGGTMLRLISITFVVVIGTLVFGLAMWPAVLGLAAAQLVMVAASVRQGMRV